MDRKGSIGALVYNNSGWQSALANLAGAYAENTIRAYRSDFEVFSSWCNGASEPALPASAETVVGFVEAISEVKAPASVQRYLCGIARVHRLLGHADPTHDDAVRLTLRRMLRTRSRRQKQALGLTADLKEQLIVACGDDLMGLRDRALISVGYDTLCRRSELVALLAEDTSPLADGSASVLVRRSKTDQTGEGRLAYLSAETVQRLSAWLDGGGVADGPMFRSIQRGAAFCRGLHPCAVTRILKRAAEAAGLGPEVVGGLSGHSMRVGAALDMVENGIDLVPVMHAGGWKSPNMVLRYTQQIALAKSGMAMLHARKRV